MDLDQAARALAESDLLLDPSRRYPPGVLWDLVHTLRFRGWLCENLAVAIPGPLAGRLASIDSATYASPLLVDPEKAVQDLLALTQALRAAADAALPVNWSARPHYLKPHHRQLADWCLFMLAHDAWHLGRAASGRAAAS